MGQNNCMCQVDRSQIKKTTQFNNERDSITAYSSYGQNQILKDQVRIMIIGTKSAGKTTLLNKLIIGEQKQGQSFSLKQLPHGGIHFRNVNINLGDIHTQNSISCRFLDVEGDYYEQEEQIKMHINSCDGFILMTDISNENSTGDVTKILKDLEKYTNKKPLLLLANKYVFEDHQKQKEELEEITSHYKNCFIQSCSIEENSEYKKSIQRIVFASAKINNSTPQ